MTSIVASFIENAQLLAVLVDVARRSIKRFKTECEKRENLNELLLVAMAKQSFQLEFGLDEMGKILDYTYI